MRLKLDEHWASFQEKHPRVPHRALPDPNPEGFPLYLSDHNFLLKCLWWLPTVCAVITSGINASRLLTFWTQTKILLYLRQGWTPHPCSPGIGELDSAGPILCFPASLPGLTLCPLLRMLSFLTLALAETHSSSPRAFSSNISTPSPPCAASQTCSSSRLRQHYVKPYITMHSPSKL